MSLNYILPNRISAEDFRLSALNWLAEGDYTPNDIFNDLISAHQIVFAPLYFYRVKYTGFCTASLGYQRWEYYYDWDNISKQQIRKSRLVTDWHPYSQPICGEVTTLVYAGNGFEDGIVSFVENMGWASGDLFMPSEYPELVEKIESLFARSKQEAWNNVGRKKVEQDVINITHSRLPSAIVQNLAVNADFEITKSFSVAAPYWVYAYKYCGNTFFTIVDGNSPERIDGKRPVNEMRKLLVSTLRSVGWIVGMYFVVLLTKSTEGITKDFMSFICWALYSSLCLLIPIVIAEGFIKRMKEKSKAIRHKLLYERENAFLTKG